MGGLVDPFGVVVQDVGAGAQSLVGGFCLRQFQDVAFLQVPVPAPQPVEALFLFLEFGEGEFLLLDFLGDFLLELAAVGQEFGPFLDACRLEGVPDQCRGGFVAGGGVNESQGAAAIAAQFPGPVQVGLECRSGRQRPYPGGYGDGSGLAQLPPDRHPVSGRF